MIKTKDCGEMPLNQITVENLGDIWNACCGHGRVAGYVQFSSGVIIRGDFKVTKRENLPDTVFAHTEAWDDRCSGDGYEHYRDSCGVVRDKDTNQPANEIELRPCKRCGKYPNENGDDYCIQSLDKLIKIQIEDLKSGFMEFQNGTKITGCFEIENPERCK